MKTQELPFKKIVHVCTNCREPGERVCCAERDSVALHANLKQWVKDQKLRRHIRVCKAGCMDRCEAGPNILLMPDNLWYSAVDEAGLERLKAKLLADVGCTLNNPG
jgi:(2Fe-2S) ferredoxin